MLAIFLIILPILSMCNNVYYTSAREYMHLTSIRAYNESHAINVYNHLKYPTNTYINETYLDLHIQVSIHHAEQSLLIAFGSELNSTYPSIHSECNHTVIYSELDEICLPHEQIMYYNNIKQRLSPIIAWLINIHPEYIIIFAGERDGGIIASLLLTYINYAYNIRTHYLYLFDTDCSQLESISNYIIKSTHYGYHHFVSPSTRCDFLVEISSKSIANYVLSPYGQKYEEQY